MGKMSLPSKERICDDCGAKMESPKFYKDTNLKVKTKQNEYYLCHECDNEYIAYTLMKRIEEAEKEITGGKK